VGLPGLEPGTSYQGGGAGSVTYRSVRNRGINKPDSGPCVETAVRRIPSSAARVGVTVGVNLILLRFLRVAFSVAPEWSPQVLP
jgi:hypothetical protein